MVKRAAASWEAAGKVEILVYLAAPSIPYMHKIDLPSGDKKKCNAHSYSFWRKKNPIT